MRKAATAMIPVAHTSEMLEEYRIPCRRTFGGTHSIVESFLTVERKEQVPANDTGT